MLDIQQSYGLEVEAVQGPVGSRLGASVQLAVWEQREQSMSWMAGVFNNFPGLPFTLPDIEVLEGRDLGPCDVLGCITHYIGNKALL